MAVSLASIGTASVATTSPLSTPYPASIASTDLLLHFIASKFVGSAHTTPTGFSFLDTEAAGTGSEFGSDRGTVVASLYDRIADGSETGSLSTTWTGLTSGSVAQGIIARITRSGGSGFSIATTTARWTTDNTNPISVTFDDAIDFAVDDYCVILYGNNSDTPTGISPTSLAASGITFGSLTAQLWAPTLEGGDQAIAYIDAVVTAGSGTATPSFEAEKTANNVGEGPLIFIRIREAAGGGAADLTVQDATHGHTADNITLSTGTTLEVQDAVHGHTADEVALSTGTSLSVADALHDHAAESPTLSTGTALVVADALHDHSADNVVLDTSDATTLTVADALHAHAADAVGLTTDATLTVADALHAHAADNITIEPLSGTTLTVQDATHAHTADSVALTLDLTLAVQDALHGHAADSVVLSVPGVATVTLRLFATPAGSSVVASATGIEWAWYDNATTLLEALADTPTVTGSGASSDASGYLSLTLTGSTKATGERGFLLFSDCTGAVDENPRTFGAMVEVD